MKYIASFFAALIVTVGTITVFTSGGNPNSSSPDRTVYSAVYALKHKNFGRFCSYLAEAMRGRADDCATSNAAGWGQNAVLFGLDIFDTASSVVPGYRAEVDDKTVTYLVNFPALEEAGYYRFTVSLQDSGKWRVSNIESVTSLPAEAERVASYGTPAAVEA